MKTTLSAREFEKILRLRGAEHVRDKGGHSIWRAPGGAMIVAVCSGRPTPVKRDAIGNAAKAFGISPGELLATKKRAS